MADPMKIRANVVGDSTEVKVLMSHEMETGQRKDAQGKTIPAWFIQNVDGDAQRQDGAAAQWGPAVAKNPFLSFKFKGGAKGDKVADHLDRQPRRQAHRRSDDRVTATVARAIDSCDAVEGERCARDRRRIAGGDAPRRRCAAGCACAGARRRPATVDEIAKYRAALQDGNPAELWEARGEELWKKPRGPKNVSLERATSAWARASSRARTRSCRSTSPTPTA